VVGRGVVFAERFIRKRFARLALALLLIGTAGWAFLPYVTHRVAASAFVNSELVRVTAPFAGRLTQALPRQGDFIPSARSLNLIEALSPDRRHLFDLQLQYALAKKTGELAQQHLQEIASLDSELAKRTELYRAAVVDQIAHESMEAEAERAGCIEELKHRDEVGLRMDTLTESGLASQIRSAEAHATARAASTRCAVAAAREDRIKVELNAARNGVFLRTGISDVPYSQQQREHLMLRRQELQTQALQESARSTQLAADIAAERERIEQLDNYRPALPAGHVVWSTTASPGSAVTEGQTILDLADCEHRFVAVELPERDFEQIKTGDVAAVRLVGSSEWREGRVRQIRGSAARADDRLFAAQIPSPGPAAITVEVSLPPDDAQSERANFCGIGRLAEVRFPRPFFDVAKLTRIGWHWLTGAPNAQTAANNTPGR
jgi:biotin carboxyl carrier protein